VTPAEYLTLVPAVAAAVQNATDPNATFNYSLPAGKLFPNVATRPLA
jgi:hypothetical protein